MKAKVYFLYKIISKGEFGTSTLGIVATDVESAIKKVREVNTTDRGPITHIDTQGYIDHIVPANGE